MPRKTTKGGKLVNAAGIELKAVRLELSPETHKKLRIEAARRDLSMAALARQFVEETLARSKEGGK
jgi:hypothetical protein